MKDFLVAELKDALGNKIKFTYDNTTQQYYVSPTSYKNYCRIVMMQSSVNQEYIHTPFKISFQTLLQAEEFDKVIESKEMKQIAAVIEDLPLESFTTKEAKDELKSYLQIFLAPLQQQIKISNPSNHSFFIAKQNQDGLDVIVTSSMGPK